MFREKRQQYGIAPKFIARSIRSKPPNEKNLYTISKTYRSNPSNIQISYFTIYLKRPT